MQDKLKRINGHRLCLRLITPADAHYVHELRTNSTYNLHLSEVTGTVSDQREWIGRYKILEAAGEELYYVVERSDAVLCGAVRLYEIGADTFTWGSFILDHNKPAKAALEAAVLSFGVGFEGLGLRRALFDARIGNTQAIAFYRRLCATEIDRDEKDVYFEYTIVQYLRDRSAHFETIYGRPSV